MAMTIEEMRTFVRTHADADVVDAPDSSLDVYARMAYHDILSRQIAWSHLYVTYSFTTVVGDPSYSIAALVGGTNMDRIVSIIDSGTLATPLRYVTRTDADIIFGVDAASPTGSPSMYTVENGEIVLFPTPSGVETFYVRGYRSEADWPTVAGSLPDLPSVFDEAICMFMLSYYFAGQEDLPMTDMYTARYEMLVQRHLRNQNLKDVTPRPSVIGRPFQRGRTFQDRLRGMVE